MQQTNNYGLNQWEMTDRIKMEDFNGDNEKVDTALAEVKATADRADSRGMKLIREVILTENAKNISLDMTGINWGDYAAICVAFDPHTGTVGGNVSCVFLGYALPTLSAAADTSNYGHIVGQVWFYPMYTEEPPIDFQTRGFSSEFSKTNDTRLSSLCSNPPRMTFDTLKAGSAIRIWGLK